MSFQTLNQRQLKKGIPKTRRIEPKYEIVSKMVEGRSQLQNILHLRPYKLKVQELAL